MVIKPLAPIRGDILVRQSDQLDFEVIEVLDGRISLLSEAEGEVSEFYESTFWTRWTRKNTYPRSRFVRGFR